MWVSEGMRKHHRRARMEYHSIHGEDYNKRKKKKRAKHLRRKKETGPSLRLRIHLQETGGKKGLLHQRQWPSTIGL
jgi:hypothetical protein